LGPLIQACVEGGHSAVSSTHEAVTRIAKIKVRSRDHPRRVDGCRRYALGTWNIECDNGGLRTAGSEQLRKGEEYANANEYVWEYFCFHKMSFLSVLYYFLGL
jgi:hypothetical protein